MMQHYKQQEIEHYDGLATRWRVQKDARKWHTDMHQLEHRIYASYTWLESWLTKHSVNTRLLDYGCGNGIHSITPARAGADEVIGIDLSEESLKIARERIQQEGVEDKIHFLKMDCETLAFLDNSFDVILDGGTFSSLDLNKALPELARVLKPGGMLIGIETLGHNPLINLKRKINVYRGIRTQWAAEHIFTMVDFTRIQHYFGHIEAHLFHLLVLAVVPFRKLPGIGAMVSALNFLDTLLLKIPFLKKYAFKTVFIFSQPKK